jgi:S-adenosylmethionine decarboxylase proenzyme
MNITGRHLLIELHDCDHAALAASAAVERAMLAAATRARATVLGHHFHQFAPHGVSGVVIIAESHISIHTWPEHAYAAVDIFTCGPSTPRAPRR